MLASNHLIGFGAADGAFTGSLSYIGSHLDTTDGTSNTFTSKNVGTAAGDRHVIVCFGGQRAGGGSADQVSSLTVGGNSASISVQSTAGSGDKAYAGIAICALASGTTATIVVNHAFTSYKVWISIYAAYGLGSTTPVQTVTDVSSPFSQSITGLVGGVFLGVAMSDATCTYTWSGVTEDYDANGDGSFSTASLSNANGGALTMAATESSGSVYSLMAGAHFR